MEDDIADILGGSKASGFIKLMMAKKKGMKPESVVKKYKGGCIRVMGETSCCGKCSDLKGGCNMCGGTKIKQNKICMTKKAYIEEHERLIKMLADTSTKTGKKAIEQAREVKKRKLKGGVILSEETKDVKGETLSDVSFSEFKDALKVYNEDSNILDFYYASPDVVAGLFTLYLLKKYKNDCYIITKDKYDMYRAGIDFLENEDEETMEEEYYETPSDEKIDFLGEQISDCIADGIKIIIIPFSYMAEVAGGGGGGHANLLIYRVSTNTFERFEPHGDIDEPFTDDVNDVLERTVNKLSKKKYVPSGAKYMPPTESCPSKGFQQLEGNEFNEKFPDEKERKELRKKIGGGFCMMWSMFALELSLIYPDKTIKEAQEIAMDEIKKLGQYGFFKHIVGFTKMGEKKIKELMSDFSFKDLKLKDKYEEYTQWYNNEVLKIINAQRGKKGKDTIKTPKGKFFINKLNVGTLANKLLSLESFISNLKLYIKDNSEKAFQNLEKIINETDEDKIINKEDYDRFVRAIWDQLPNSMKGKGFRGGVLSKETKEKLAMERQAYAKDMRENPEKYVAKSFDPSEGGMKEPCSYRRALDKGGVSFNHLTSAGYQTPEDCQNIQQANINEGQRRMLENESGINKFFRGVVEGLTKVADFAVDLPFVPTIAKEGYKAFAPPTSSYYADSMTRAFSGDGKKRKMKGGRPSWAITMRKPQTREQELELEKIRNPYYGQPMVECPDIPQVKARDGAVIFQGSKAKQTEEGRCDAMIRGYESAMKTKQWRDENLGVSGFVSGLSKFVQPIADVASFLPVVGSVARGISSGIDVAKNITDMAYAGNGKYKIKGKKITTLKGAGMKPEEKTFFLTAEQTYSNRPPKQIGDFLLIGDSPTIDAWLNYKTNTIMIAVRGTKDFRDVKADTSLPFNNLTNTNRYQNDRNIIASLSRTFNPSVYDYYLTGHSLGGAIVSQLKRDFPFLKDAVLYNSAFQPKDLVQQSSGSIKRVYTTDDPLYNAGGKFFINSRVVPINTTAIDGILGRVIRGYKGHKLSKFRELYAM